MQLLGGLAAGTLEESKQVASEGRAWTGEEDCLKEGEGVWLRNAGFLSPEVASDPVKELQHSQ